MLDKLLVILILSLPFGQLTRITVLRPEIHFYLHDLVVALMLIVRLVKGNFKKIFKNELIKPIFAFSLLALFSLLVNFSRFQTDQLLVAFLYLLRWTGYALVYFIFAEFVKNHPKKKKMFYKLLIYMVLSLAVFGLIQYLFYPDFRAFEAYNWDPHYYRLVSTLFDPGFTGMILVLGLILLVVRFWKEIDNFKINTTKLLFLIIYVALALSYSRSSFLAYFVGFLLISWQKKAWRFFAILCLLGVITIFLLPRPGGEGVRLERTTSIQVRLENWQRGIEIFKENPVFGVGFNTLRYVQRDYSFLGDWQESHAAAGLDSSLLFVLVTTGLVGFFAFVRLLKNIYAKGSLVIKASLAALVIHSLFNNTLFYPWSMLWLWLILGL